MSQGLKDRVLEYCSKKNLAISAFEKTAGLSNGYFNQVKKRPSISKTESINRAFPDLNIQWLMTGEGEMLNPVPISDTDYRMVPVYNFDAVGGMHGTNSIIDAPAYIERHIPFINAHQDDIGVYVTGNSMIPTYPPGSIILIRKVENWQEYFGYGHCFVIFLKDGRRILKEVQRCNENPKDYVLCVSHNKEYPAEELPKSIIVGVYKVIMTLTNEGF